MSLKKRFTAGGAFSYVYLTLLCILAVFPLVWLVVSAFKSSGEMLANPTKILPMDWTLENFKTVLFTLRFTVNIKNSLIIALATTLVATVISALAAYGIIRFFPKLGNIMTKILITSYMFPSIMLVIPYAVVMRNIHLTNTRTGLVLVYMSFSVPYAVWMLVGFFKTVPIGIEEAARIDGLSEYGTFARIVLPLTKPAMATLTIMSFVTVWNDYMGPMIYFNSDRLKTIQLGIQLFVGQYSAEYGLIMATSVMAIIPVLVVFLAFQRFFVEGIASSGLKG